MSNSYLISFMHFVAKAGVNFCQTAFPKYMCQMLSYINGHGFGMRGSLIIKYRCNSQATVYFSFFSCSTVVILFAFLFHFRTWTESSIMPRTAIEPKLGCANLLSADVERATKRLRVSATTPSTSTHPSLLTSSLSCSSRLSEWPVLSLRPRQHSSEYLHYQQQFPISLCSSQLFLSLLFHLAMTLYFHCMI